MINRSQDASGAWTYADEDEHNFVVWVEVGCSTSREHSFASGLPVPWRHSLLSMDGFINGDSRPLTTSERDQLMFLRNKAFEAYKAGDYSLQDSKLGELQSECRRLGQLPLARAGAKQRAHIKAISRLPRNTCKVPGVEPFSVVSITRQLAKRKDTVGGWVPAAELWQLLFDALDEMGLEPKRLCDRITFYKEPAIGDDREDADRKTTMFSTFKVTISKERNKVS